MCVCAKSLKAADKNEEDLINTAADSLNEDETQLCVLYIAVNAFKGRFYYDLRTSLF